MKVSVIFARSLNHVIGVNGKLPWRIKHDLQYFKSMTVEKVVIMGRKTWESFGSKPLPHRTNVIISTTMEPNVPGITFEKQTVFVFKSLEEALNYFEQNETNEVFIIGGKNLIEEGVKIASNIYVTSVQEIIPLRTQNCVQLDVDFSYTDVDEVKFRANNFEAKFSIESVVSCTEAMKNYKPSTFEIVHLKRI